MLVGRFIVANHTHERGFTVDDITILRAICHMLFVSIFLSRGEFPSIFSDLREIAAMGSSLVIEALVLHHRG
jgi:hypothetical protein